MGSGAPSTIQSMVLLPPTGPRILFGMGKRLKLGVNAAIKKMSRNGTEQFVHNKRMKYQPFIKQFRVSKTFVKKQAKRNLEANCIN